MNVYSKIISFKGCSFLPEGRKWPGIDMLPQATGTYIHVTDVGMLIALVSL